MLSLYTTRPVANGLRTDHPIPDLPFVDDSHVPVDDPQALEAVGRHPGTDMWGREDQCRDGGWAAFTTDPVRHDLAWCVRWHPEHGRSVVLYRDADAANAHTNLTDTPLLYRAGGYWWDGQTWFRPSQIWDPAGESYVRRPVPSASTINAADLLRTGGDPTQARILNISEVNVDDTIPGHRRWLDDLALWAQRRPSDIPLSDSVVKIAAPEFSGDELVSVTGLAEIAAVAASTVRAYLSRGEGDIPPPQAIVNGRNMWTRPVAEEWAEQRHHSPESIAAAVQTAQIGDSPAAEGIGELYQWLTKMFLTRLWENPARRKRWALRWRTEAAVRDTAQDLGWSVAGNLQRIVPLTDLGRTIHDAVMHDLVAGHAKQEQEHWYFIAPWTARMLDWLISHEHTIAAHVVGEIVGDAERDLAIPRPVTKASIQVALNLDGKLATDTRDKFLERVLSPS